jgi:rhamnose transport system substrate-binding protein
MSALAEKFNYRWVVAMIAILALAVGLAACGGSDSSSSSDTGEAEESAPAEEEGGEEEAGEEEPAEEAAENESAPGESIQPIGTSEKDPSEMKVRVLTQIDGVPYYQSVEEGVKEASEKLGIGDYEVTGPPRVDSGLQVGTMQTWIAEGVDIIGVSSTDPEAMTPVINEAIAAGITVISYDVDAPKSERPVYVNGWSEEEGPQVLMETFAGELGGKSAKGQYATILPSLTAETHQGWLNTAKAFQEKEYPGLEEVARVGVEADQTIGAEKAKQLKSKYPNLVGIMSVDAGGTVGIAQATEELGLVGKFANVGLSTPEQMKEFILDGTTNHAVLWNPIEIGYLTTQIGYELATGKEITNEEELPVSDKENRKIPLVEWNGAMQAIAGPALVFDKQNVADFPF